MLYNWTALNNWIKKTANDPIALGYCKNIFPQTSNYYSGHIMSIKVIYLGILRLFTWYKNYVQLKKLITNLSLISLQYTYTLYSALDIL